MRCKYLSLILVLTHVLVHAQKLPDEQQLLEALRNKDAALYGKKDSTIFSYYIADSVRRMQLFEFFDKHSHGDNIYIAARSLAWKGIMIERSPFNRRQGEAYLQQAVNKAVESGDECLMVQCFEGMGDYGLSAGKPEISLFYFMKSYELRT